MALNFNVLAQTPSIVQRFYQGQQDVRREADENLLRQRQAMTFEQAQQDRARKMQRDQQLQDVYKKTADLIRQHGKDPDNPEVLQEGLAAATEAGSPQMAAVFSGMLETIAKRRATQDEMARIRAARSGQPFEAPSATAAPAAGAPLIEPPATPQIAATAFDEGRGARPETPPPGVGARSMAVTPQPTAVTTRELPAPSVMIGAAPPVNRLAPTPAAAPTNALNARPASQDANAAAMAALERERQALMAMDFTPRVQAAIADVDRRMKQLEPKTYAPQELERLLDLKARMAPNDPDRSVIQARIDKLTKESKGVTVEMPVAIYDPDTKTVRYVPRSEAIGKAPASAAPKEKPEKEPPVSAQQAATATARLLQRTNEIFEVLKTAPSAEAPGALEAAVGATPGISAATNLLRSSERQIVASAQDDILDALLYLATGAAYNKEQLQQQKNAYLSNWSDTPATRAVKRKRLVDMIGNAKIRAGAAWTPDLDKQMSTLFELAGQQAGGAKSQDAAAVPKGVDPEDWKYMTPEERKLWNK